MTIEQMYRPQAQRAADLYYTLLGAVEACGADPELTSLVVRLSDDHRRIRELFGLDPMQITRVIQPDDIYPLHAEPDHECSICGCHLPAERVRSREERQRANDAERLLEEMLPMDADKHENACSRCGEEWPCWTARVRDFLEG